MKFGTEFWQILFRKYISPNLFAVCITAASIKGIRKAVLWIFNYVFWIRIREISAKHKQRQTERRKAGIMQSDLDSGHADNG
jgi:hypothetical protein